jgi:hypothetical protein
MNTLRHLTLGHERCSTLSDGESRQDVSKYRMADGRYGRCALWIDVGRYLSLHRCDGIYCEVIYITTTVDHS